ncbi:MAG TPA: flagellar biosynthetic protein FliO [Polyangiales bacterium]|jgi:flagellar biogenesis protein FliO|nr:flagellar biosynthetic protein FliO [Polyangiales bacterium]
MDGGTALDSMLRMLLALAGVCALAWVVLSLLARRGLLQFASGLAGKSGRLRVLERVSLSPRRQLFLVQADSRVFLVGTGEAGPPALIAELDGEDRERPLRAARMEAAS